MSAPIHSTDDILAALREHPESTTPANRFAVWPELVLKVFLADPVETEEIRSRLLTRELIELPGKFAAAEESRKSDANTILDLIQKGEEARQKDSQAVLEAIGKLTERMDQLAEAQRKTDETLNAFMQSTDKQFGQLKGKIGDLRGDIFQIKALPMFIRKLASKMDGVAIVDANTEGALL
ncbi:hypothetical protein [Verrucomicrobium sp. 3C]|uniref:hypothetical protein n=1 Tax=Verrucomicrobium sp. 3C TaxID=1134055 RepID=UPI00037E9F8C|nr:hypothetical protein [Verrucomicrobium sp. 3C]